jgi:hypothetical protein
MPNVRSGPLDRNVRGVRARKPLQTILEMVLSPNCRVAPATFPQVGGALARTVALPRRGAASADGGARAAMQAETTANPRAALTWGEARSRCPRTMPD